MLGLCAQNSLVAQKTDYLFNHVSVVNGLVSNNVRAIFQDKQGYMWIGTQTGLQRYDGKRFKTYLADVTDKEALQSDWISGFLEDSRQRFWIGSSVSGASLFDRNTGKFHNFNLTLKPGHKKITGIWQFLEDKQGAVWVAAFNGYYKFDEGSQQFENMDSVLKMSRNVLASSITLDAAGDLWFCTTAGVKKLEQKTGNLLDRNNNPRHLKIFNLPACSSISFDKKGNVWISTGYDRFLYRYTLADDKMTEYSFDQKGKSGTKNPLEKEFVGNPFVSSNGCLFVPLLSSGVATYNYASDTFAIINVENSLTYGIHADPFTYGSMVISEDIEKNLWIGTDEGINICSLDDLPFKHYGVRLPGKKDPLSSAEVSDLMQARSGDVYAGYYTANGGVLRFDKNFNFKEEYIYRSGDRDDGVRNQIWTVFQQADGKIWAPSQAGTRLEIDPAGSEIKSVVDTALWGSINEMQLDGDNNTWIAHDSRGLLKLDGISKKVTRYNQFKNYAGERKRVLSFLFDADKIWVGTTFNGLQLFDKRSGTFTEGFMTDLNDSHSISNNTITGILSYNADTLIIATQSGINIFDKRSKVFTNISSRNGLPNNLTQGIALDDRKQLWAAFAGGLSKIDIHTRRIVNYDERDGVISNQFNHRFLKLADGRLAIGAQKGFLVFNPLAVAKSAAPPDVTITGFKVFARSMIIDSFINNKVPVKLPYTDNSFEIEFASLQYNASYRTSYVYQLEGIDKDWVPANADGTVNYNKLPAGDYVFKVKCANREGVFSKNITSFSIHIIPPFYKTIWFGLFCALLFAGGIYAFMKWRERNIRDIEAGKTKLQQLTAEKYKTQFEAEQISNFFSSSLLDKNEVDDVLWDVAKNLISKLGFVDCMIYLWNDDKTVLVQKAGYGPKGSIEELENKHFEVLPGQGVVGTVAQSGQALIIPDTSKDKRYRIDDAERSSELCIPIKYNEELIGVIDSEHHDKNFFTGQHLQLLTTIATLVAGKITSIKAEQKLRHQRAELADINQQLAEVQLAALRSQMNPHFIFNALNSIKKFVIANEPANAEKYLGKFSKLIRSILDNSQRGMVTVEKELQLLTLYLDLEQLRFGKKLEYTIEVDERINTSDIEIPSMIVQPFVENSMLHGIMHREKGGRVDIRFVYHHEWLEIAVEDNGVGRKKSAEYKSDNGEPHHSVGIAIATKRLQALKKSDATPAGIQVVDLQDETGVGNGTKVIISIPIH